MADPIAMLDAEARTLYEAHLKRTDRQWVGLMARPSWEKASNAVREEWRGKALLALRSEETLADELKREERLRSKLSDQVSPSEERR